MTITRVKKSKSNAERSSCTRYMCVCLSRVGYKSEDGEAYVITNFVIFTLEKNMTSTNKPNGMRRTEQVTGTGDT